MKCPNCHAENRENAKFCDQCGFPLQGKIAEIAALADAEDSEWDAIERKDGVADDEDEETASGSESDELSESDAAEDTPDVPDTLDTPVDDAEAESETEADQNGADGEEDHGQKAEPAPLPAADETDDAEDNSKVEAVETEDVSTDVADDAKAEPDESAGKTVTLPRITPEDFQHEASKTMKLPPISADTTADLSGFTQSITGEQILDPYQEKLVRDFKPAKPDFHDGQTMEMPVITDEDEPQTTDFKASSTVKKSHKSAKIVGAIIGVLAVVAIVALAVTYQMQLWGGKVVPDVSGMTQSEATSTLEASGFTVRATQVKSDDDAGYVLVEDPEAGARAPEGSEVVIHISVNRVIPDVVGKTQDEATALMNDEGFTAVTYKTERSDEEKGSVLSVSPDAGTVAAAAAEITVTVAEPYTVPDVSGMTVAQAEQAIRDAGLTPNPAYVDTTAYTDGSLIGIDPVAGTEVQSDSYVTVSIARARAAQLNAATRSYLASGSTVTIQGVNYIVNSLDSVSYVGNNTTAYTITATPYVSLLGETISGSARTVTGQIVWTDDNKVSAIS